MYIIKNLLDLFTVQFMTERFDVGRSRFFARFMEEMDSMSENTVEMFEILDQITAVNPHVSHEGYLESAILIKKNADKTFVKRRNIEFFTWIFDKLSQRSKKLYSHFASCSIECCKHVVIFPFQSIEVLGLLVETGNIPMDIDRIKQQLLERIQNILFVEGSAFYLVDRKKMLTNTTLYFEVQKKGGKFTVSDTERIKYELGEVIMRDAPIVFAPLENHEFLIKTLRWIMNELHDGDLPHVFIDFSQQTTQSLYFSALVCSIKEDITLDQKLKHPQLHVEWSTVEKRKSTVKEGVIANIEIPMSPYFPMIAARNEASRLLRSLLGDFRDFNGGLLEKIEENFATLKANVSAPPLALREFFGSISPQNKQATLPPSILKIIYEELEKQKQSDREISYTERKEENLIAVTIKIFPGKSDRDLKKALSPVFSHLHFASIHRPTYTIVSCFLLSPTAEEIALLQSKTQSIYQQWSRPEELKQTLRLCATTTFDSFDPRMGTEQETSYLHKMLFEGLMRLNPDGKPEPAIAEKVELFNDGRCYRFFLRKSYWSNGMPLTAEDFAYSWKKSLTPEFFAPLVYLFNVIENAEAIKNGELPPEKLGVKVISDQILEVHLTYPDPYFLETCTLSLFSPICKKVDITHPSWPESQGKDFVCNGPFTLDRKVEDQYLILSKNVYYWKNSQVHLQHVTISFLDEEKSLELFQKKQIDALLYPFCRDIEKAFPLKEKAVNLLKGPIYTRYLAMDCSKPPFNNKKIRQALSLALCKNELAEKFSKEAIPYYSVYPQGVQQKNIALMNSANRISLAQKLFHEAIEEYPHLEETLFKQKIYGWNYKNFTEALCRQLNQIFSLDWTPIIEKKITFSQYLRTRKDPLKLFGWINRTSDPKYFLEIFGSSKYLANLTNWTHPSIHLIIDQLKQVNCAKKRMDLHLHAEEILNEELPLIPLFSTQTHSLYHSCVNNMHSNFLQPFDIQQIHKS